MGWSIEVGAAVGLVAGTAVGAGVGCCTAVGAGVGCCRQRCSSSSSRCSCRVRRARPASHQADLRRWRSWGLLSIPVWRCHHAFSWRSGTFISTRRRVPLRDKPLCGSPSLCRPRTSVGSASEAAAPTGSGPKSEDPQIQKKLKADTCRLRVVERSSIGDPNGRCSANVAPVSLQAATYFKGS